MNILSIVGRNKRLFDEDISINENDIRSRLNGAKVLIIGGAGSIGQAVVKEFFKRDPKKLHVLDISENNLVELVRDIRSSLGYIKGDFRTFAIDCGSDLFNKLVDAEGPYDYVLNLSALKHVRSEKDVYTLMRMVETNILNVIKTVDKVKHIGAEKYFCVSTDKAANPVNMMGASKRIMEFFLMEKSREIPVSMARFANVAFSDGSLLHGFNMRLLKKQPISAPNDVERYFIIPEESGELCMMSCLFGENREIFFPKNTNELKLTKFSDVAVRYLEHIGYEPYICDTEEEARSKVSELSEKRKWPCYFFESDTTGEKGFEEFYTNDEKINLEKFISIGIVTPELLFDSSKLHYFIDRVSKMRNYQVFEKRDMVDLFNTMIPNFNHLEKGKYLDQRM